MMAFLKRLLGGSARENESAAPTANAKPPIPDDVLAEFTSWFFAQRKPAVELRPDPGGPIGATGSRLGGPAWLAEGEAWPIDAQGVPLEFLAQLDLADCRSLPGFPHDGIVQFFIGRDDVYGADFDHPRRGNFLVRLCRPNAAGALHAPPALAEVNGVFGSNFSPFSGNGVRVRGIALAPEAVEDSIDGSIIEADTRIHELYRQFDIGSLEDILEAPQNERPIRHHAGGYPAFTQSDIRHQADNADLDQVLLRVTSDDNVMWGDAGEAVFMIRQADLAAGNFGETVYSWDCS